MKFKLKLYKTLLTIITIFSACSKEVPLISKDQQVQNAINEIRKIVGVNSSIKVIDNKNSLTVATSIDEVKSKNLTLEQLKDMYTNVNDKSRLVFSSIKRMEDEGKQNEIKSSSVSSFEFYDDTLRPGNYKAVFRGPTLLYSTIIYFSIGNYSEVVGTPSAIISANYYYDPYFFTSTSVSAISFNSTNSVSQFSISGYLSLNVGLGGMSFNIISRDIIFDISVSSNDGIIGLK